MPKQKKEEKIYISWTEFEECIAILLSELPEKKFKRIVAITRGGLLLAYYLAKHLDIKIIDTFCIESYSNDNKQKKITIHKQPENQTYAFQEEVLIVDDLIDSGETLRLATKELPKATVAVLFRKENSPKDIGHYYADELPNKWVEFPWEN